MATIICIWSQLLMTSNRSSDCSGEHYLKNTQTVNTHTLMMVSKWTPMKSTACGTNACFIVTSNVVISWTMSCHNTWQGSPPDRHRHNTSINPPSTNTLATCEGKELVSQVQCCMSLSQSIPTLFIVARCTEAFNLNSKKPYFPFTFFRLNFHQRVRHTYSCSQTTSL